MATELIEEPLVAALPFEPRRLTLDEYRKIRDSGVLDDGPRYEFLEGWIVTKTTQGPEHNLVVNRCRKWLERIVPEHWEFRVQSAIAASISEPEPDLSIIIGPDNRYADHHPTGEEIGLLIEVADSSLARDRRKARIYADAGIPNYWIVNLIDRQVEVFRNPLSDGLGYRDKHVALLDEMLEARLDDAAVLTIPVLEILGELGTK